MCHKPICIIFRVARGTASVNASLFTHVMDPCKYVQRTDWGVGEWDDWIHARADLTGGLIHTRDVNANSGVVECLIVADPDGKLRALPINKLQCMFEAYIRGYVEKG